MTRIPSGATGPCGSKPTSRATSFVGRECSDCPSRRICPSWGAINRVKLLSSVDLPHALGPTITVKRPSGISRSTPGQMTLSAYPSRALSTKRRVIYVDLLSLTTTGNTRRRWIRRQFQLEVGIQDQFFVQPCPQGLTGMSPRLRWEPEPGHPRELSAGQSVA